MRAASLPGTSGKNGGDSAGEALGVIGDDQPHPGETSGRKTAQELGPGGSVFSREGIESRDLAATIGERPR